MPGYEPQSDDTSEHIDRIVFDGFRRMSPAQRLKLASDASLAVEQIGIAGLRTRFPDASEEELRRRCGAIRLGAELTRRAFGARAEEWLD